MENPGLEIETYEKEKHEYCDLKISVNKSPTQISRESVNKNVIYSVEDLPPWYLCVLLGIQHYLTMFGATITYPFLITPKLCIREDDPARGYIIATNFFVSGLATLFQATLGVRLPIVQGSTFTLLVPTFAILDLPQWRCPNHTEIIAARETNQSHSLTGEGLSYDVTETEWEELWQSRMREIQGAVIIASLFEVFIGFTGIIGFLLHWITPLAIVPTIILIGLPLFREAAGSASQNWGIAVLTMFVMAFFSQYLRNVDLPVCSYKKVEGWRLRTFPFFKLFPVLLTILVVWLLCFVLTTTESIYPDNPARTDTRMNVLHSSPWFRFPYPGITVPEWMKSNPDAVNVGNDVASNIITVLLSTSMFVGGFLGLLLDNTIPGTEEERGLIKWREHTQVRGISTSENEEGGIESTCYDFPVGMGILRRLNYFSYFPISPTYNNRLLFGKCRACKVKRKHNG